MLLSAAAATAVVVAAAAAAVFAAARVCAAIEPTTDVVVGDVVAAAGDVEFVLVIAAVCPRLPDFDEEQSVFILLGIFYLASKYGELFLYPISV